MGRSKFLSVLVVLILGLSHSGELLGQSSRSLEQRRSEKSDAVPEVDHATQLRPGSSEERIKSLAATGDAKALYEWGLLLEQDVVGKPNLAEAAKSFRAAAEKQYVPAMVAWGNALFYERGVEKDLAKALDWYRRAAEARDPVGMHNLGVLYERGLGIEKNIETALDWYKQADEARFATPQQSIARIARSRKLAEEAARQMTDVPIADIQARADHGDAIAMWNMAQHLIYGLGVEKDESRAVALLQAATEKNDPVAFVSLGQLYFYGQGTPKDETRAVALFRRAAELGDRNGISNLANAFNEGIGGVKQDRQQALDLYVKAAALGEPGAMFNIAEYYRNGWIALDKTPHAQSGKELLDFLRGTSEAGQLKYDPQLGRKDPVTAVTWYRRAAELGDTNCMNSMGRAYELGEGVRMNPDVAYDWYRAAAPYNDLAKQNVRRLALRDGFSAYATHIEALSAANDDPDKPRLYAVAIANSYYGQGGAPKNPGRAYSYLLTAPQGVECPELAEIALEIGVAIQFTDSSSAHSYYLAAFNAGDPDGAMNMGMSLAQSNPQESEKYYQQGEELAAKKKLSTSRGVFHVVHPYRSGPFVRQRKAKQPDPPVALPKPVEELIRLADGGDADAAYVLGLHLMQQRESQQAFSRMTAAAEQKHAKAMYTLGFWYDYGRGTASNSELAVEWYKKAGEAGEPDGYAGAGFIYGIWAIDPARHHDLNDGHDGLADMYHEQEFLTAGAEKGSVRAMRLLALFNQRLGSTDRIAPGTAAKPVVEKDWNKAAVKWFTAAAELGDVESMRNVAWHLENGFGVEKNIDQALLWSRKAVAKGDVTAITQTAIRLFQRNTPESDTESIEMLTTALKADPEFDEAAAMLAWAKENGRGMEKNVAEAVADYRRLAWRGDEPSRESWRRLDPASAAIYDLRTAIDNSAGDSAKFELAKAYAQGVGVERELALTARWAWDASTSQNANLEYVAVYASLLAEGIGCDALPQRALELLAPGIEQNHPRCLGTLGELLVAAKGYPADDERGLELLTKAAQLGDVRAIEQLGRIYRGGLGTPACGGLACDWWRMAADKKHVPAILALGDAFVEGQGTPLDDHAASRWYFRAWELKDAQGFDRFDLIAAKILEIPAQHAIGPFGTNQPARLNYNEVYQFAQERVPQAMFKLGRMQMEGIGVPRDPVTGKEWIEKAANADDPSARRYFARMYRLGDGVNKDENFAKYWDTKAQEAEADAKLRRQ